MRIREALESRETTPKQLSAMTGVHYNSITAYMRQEYEPTSDNLQRIANALNINPTWLAGFDAPMNVWETSTPTDATIRVVAQKVSAGNGEEIFQNNETAETISFPTKYIRHYPSNKIFAAEVKGDSMTGVQLFDGDIVIFVKGVIEGDGIYVLSIDNALYVKRVEFDPIDKVLTIKSENPRYEPKKVKADSDVIRIEGKVIGWLHHHPY